MKKYTRSAIALILSILLGLGSPGFGFVSAVEGAKDSGKPPFAMIKEQTQDVGKPVVFVESLGNDTDSGISPATAKKTMSAAADVLKNTGGIIVVCGPLHLGAWFETADSGLNKITITSVYDGVDYAQTQAAAVIVNGGNAAFNGDYKFENLTIINTDMQERFWVAKGNKLVLGDNITCQSVNGKWLGIIGGYLGNISGNPEIEIHSGVYSVAVGGSRYGILDGSAQMTIYGGTFKGTNGTSIIGGGMLANSPVTGNTSVTIYDGTFEGKVTAGGSIQGDTRTGASSVQGNTSLVIYGGDFHDSVAAGGIDAPVTGNTQLVITDGTFSGSGKVVNGAGFQTSTAAPNAAVGGSSVLVQGGTFHGYVSGGAYNATVNGDVTLEICGGVFYSHVMGGGTHWNDDCSIAGNVNVDISGGEFQGNFFGGIRGAADGLHSKINGKTDVIISGGTFWGEFYGAGSEPLYEDTRLIVEGGEFKNSMIASGTGFVKAGGTILTRFVGNNYSLASGKGFYAVNTSGAYPADAILDLSDADSVDPFAAVIWGTGARAFSSILQPVSFVTGIQIQSPPSKLDYFDGDSMDLSGLQLVVFYANQLAGTSSALISYDKYDDEAKPAHFSVIPSVLSGTDSQVVLQYGVSTATQIVNVTDDSDFVLSAITVKKIRDTYYAGSVFDFSKLVVTAHYVGTDYTKDINSSDPALTLSLSGPLSPEDDHVLISYTHNGVSAAAEVPIHITPDDVVFVSDSGTGDGSSAEYALEAAVIYPYEPDQVERYDQNSVLYQAVDRLRETGGTVVLCGAVLLDRETSYGSGSANCDVLLPPHSDHLITFTSLYGGVDYAARDGAKLTIATPAQVTLNGRTRWENLTIETDGTERIIACAGFPTVFGEGVITLAAGYEPNVTNANRFLSITGGNRYQSFSSAEGTSVEVQSGTYYYLTGGLWGFHDTGMTYSYTGDTKIRISGTTTVLGGINGGGHHVNTVHSGDATILLYGGKFYGIISGSNSNGAPNSVRIKINAGDLTEIVGIHGGFVSADSESNIKVVNAVLDCSEYDQAQFHTLNGKYSIEPDVKETAYFNKLYLPGESGTTEDGKIHADISAMRTAAVAYMQAMSDIEWVAAQTFTMPDGKTYSQGATYRGYPYKKARGGLDEFLRYYDENTHLYAPPAGGAAPGNNASYAVVNSWAQIDNEVVADSVEELLPNAQKGTIKVGEYEIGTNTADTTGILSQNTEQTMFAAYAQLQAGDAVITTAGGGRAGMVLSVALIQTDPAGGIAADTSRVTFVEQTPDWQPNQTIPTSYRTVTCTFSELFSQGFLPVTTPALATGLIVEPHTGLSGSVRTLRDLFNCTVYSNYDLAYVNLVMTKDGESEPYYQTTHSPMRNYPTTPRSRALSTFVEAQAYLSLIQQGCLNIKVTAKAHGEAVVLVDCDYTITQSASGNTLFISDDGTGDGSSPETPLGKSEAVKYISGVVQRYDQNSPLYQAADLLKDKGGTIVLCGPVMIDETTSYGSSAVNRDFYLPRNAQNIITITSVYNGVDYRLTGAKLTIKTPGNLQTEGKIIWENINIVTDGTDRVIACGDFETVFGEGVITTAANGKAAIPQNAAYFPSIAGSSRFFSSKRISETNVTVQSGVYNKIVGGIWGVAIENQVFHFVGDTNLTLAGDITVLGGIYGGSNDNNAFHSGNANITIRGGMYHGFIRGANSYGFGNKDAAVRIKFTGGNFADSLKVNGGTPGTALYSQPYDTILDLSEAGPELTASLSEKYQVSQECFSSGFRQVIEFGEDPLLPEPVWIAGDTDEMRQQAYDFMVAMSQVEWSPDSTFQSIPELTYLAGEDYRGIPYTTNAIGTLEVFLSNLDSEGVYLGETETALVRGTHCSNSIFQSWEQIGNSVTAVVTDHMAPSRGYGLLALGDYDYSMYSNMTHAIILANSEDIMFEAYALLQKGDAILFRNPSGGHTRMLCGVPHLVRDPETGKIDGEQSYVTTIEQTNSWDETSSTPTSWWVDHRYTFSQLRTSYYIPVTTVELQTGITAAPRLILSVPDTTAPVSKLEQLLAGTVFSNYAMHVVRVSLVSDDTGTIYERTYYPISPYTSVALSNFTEVQEIADNLPAGTIYTFQMEAKIRGEYQTVVSVAFASEIS